MGYLFKYVLNPYSEHQKNPERFTRMVVGVLLEFSRIQASTWRTTTPRRVELDGCVFSYLFFLVRATRPRYLGVAFLLPGLLGDDSPVMSSLGWPLRIWSFGPDRLCLVSKMNGPTSRTQDSCESAMNKPMQLRSVCFSLAVQITPPLSLAVVDHIAHVGFVSQGRELPRRGLAFGRQGGQLDAYP
jgi:hypothetical protein